MVTHYLNSLCEQARIYYYAMITQENAQEIPAEVQDHVRSCPYCQAQIEHLQQELQPPADNTSPNARLLGTLWKGLGLHFSYRDQPVTCQQVRPFLPSLTLPVAKIDIVTPITQHITECPACENDLETIAKLELTPSQLYRLTGLLKGPSEMMPFSCSEARPHLLEFATHFTIAPNSIPALQHLVTCPACRQAVHQARQSLHNSLSGKKLKLNYTYTNVSKADLFDYVVPIDRDSTSQIQYSDPLGRHLCQCPACLKRLLDLQRVIYEIAERPSSGIVSFYKPEMLERVPLGEADEREEEIPYRQTSRAFSGRREIWRIGIPLAAAAVMLVGLAIFFRIPSAQAVTLEQIYQALQKADCVAIASFSPSKEQPIQERWISRPDQLRLIRDKSNVVLWDFQTGTKKVKSLKTGQITQTNLTGDIITNGLKSFEGAFGIIPYTKGTDLPYNLRWENIAIEEVEEKTLPDTKVYDLTWQEGGRDKKWRFFVDLYTCLPKKNEGFEKMSNEKNFKLASREVVQYPSREEIQTLVKLYFE